MKILQMRALRGPNNFATFPVLRMTLDLEDLRDCNSAEAEGFVDRLLHALPGVIEHRCSRGYPGGFVDRLREGTYFGHIVEHVALELSTPAEIEATFGKTVYAGSHGVYDVVVEYEDESATRVLLEAAVAGCDALVKHEEFDFEPAIAEARSLARAHRLGPSAKAILDAATRRGIPWTRLNDQSLAVLGYGVHRRYIEASTTHRTSFIAVELAGDKQLTKDLLASAGLPVPEGRVVHSEDDAVDALHELGAPVVVKPLDGNQGRGVSLRVGDEAAVRSAYRVAATVRPRILVERQIEGRNFRALVIGGKLVALAQRFPPHVIGDGEHTIRELVAIENRNPLRQEGHSGVLSTIDLDAVAQSFLERDGRGLEAVPAAGERVELRESINLSTGGTAKDVTDDAHPDLVYACERAARTIGLDVCGIDLVCRDIASPLTAQGAIIEVNAAPGLRMHEHPSEGRSRAVGEAIIESLYPSGTPSRIPIVSVTGTNGKTTVTRMIAHIVQGAGLCVGMASTGKVSIGGRAILSGDMTGPYAARLVLHDPSVEVAVLETARGGIVRRGLGYDWSDVGVITNIQPDHFGQDGIETLDDLVRVKRLVAERVCQGGTLVLNAECSRTAMLVDDALVRRIERKVAYFARNPDNAVLVEAVAQGGRGYTVIDGEIVELEEGAVNTVLRTADIPATLWGVAGYAVANALAAVAAARAAGATIAQVVQGLRSFDSERDNPGRLNLYRLESGYAVVDYGHNVGAFEATCDLVHALHPRRSTAVLSVPGDRTRSLAEWVGRVAARGFDRIIVKDDYDRRGRAPLEMPTLVADAIRAVDPNRPCFVFDDEQRAVRHALGDLGEGEVVFLFSEDPDAIGELLRAHGARTATHFELTSRASGYARLAG